MSHTEERLLGVGAEEELTGDWIKLIMKSCNISNFFTNIIRVEIARG
jgi:hypothetical protein